MRLSLLQPKLLTLTPGARLVTLFSAWKCHKTDDFEIQMALVRQEYIHSLPRVTKAKHVGALGMSYDD